MNDDITRTLFQGSPEEEERFKYDVIRGLSESVRAQAASTLQLATQMADMQKTQVGMLERLAVLEAGKFAASISEIDKRVDALMRDKDRRDGAIGMLGTIKNWAPFLAMLFSAACMLWLYGRSIGVVPAPPVAPAAVEATIRPDQRTIDGTISPRTDGK